jgi:DNA-binding NarL/FixJ family response regulator
VSAAGAPDVIRILLVDDHELVRAGLRTFLELQPDMVVVGEAGVPRLTCDLVHDRGCSCWSVG